MIQVNRAALENAIWSGYNAAGEWRLCCVDGEVYWHAYYVHEQKPAHARHAAIFVPALFPDGAGTERTFFLYWAEKRVGGARGQELLGWARGSPASDGIAYATACIIEQVLTVEERLQWQWFLADYVAKSAEGCLVQLNDRSIRARFCFG